MLSDIIVCENQHLAAMTTSTNRMTFVPLQLYAVLLLLLFIDGIAPQSLVETLPGFPGKLPFTLETGYIGVGKSEQLQLFYYFIRSERSPENDPLILWLTGGPGCSGLSSLLYEFGPFTIDYENSNGGKVALKLNPYSWTKLANIIFIDSPVGTGFSYATTADAYKTSDMQSVSDAYDFLRKWLINHPTFLGNPLYIGGESYAGKIVPILVEEIYIGNEVRNEPLINIKGYMEGNSFTDNNDINSRIEYAYRLALISDKIYESVKANCDGQYVSVDPNNTLCVRDIQVVTKCTERIYASQILEPWCARIWKPKADLLAWDVDSFEENSQYLYSSLPLTLGTWCRQYNYVYCGIWANDRTSQRDLHVREGTVEGWMRCNKSIVSDASDGKAISYTLDVQSSLEYHRRLTDRSCRTFIYSGDHDMNVPYFATEEWINSLGLPIDSDWRPWYVEDQVAGYTMRYSKDDYDLTYATVKGAGHTAPEFKPKQCFAMVSRWFAQSPL